jgi:hypothetical protein
MKWNLPSDPVVASISIPFPEIEIVDIRSDSEHQISLIDEAAPVFIKDLSWSPDTFDQKKYIHVRCFVEDEDSGVISEIILQYRTNGGKWANVTMFHTEGSTYEAILPRFDIGDEVEVRAIATDPFNNTAISNIGKMDIGRELMVSGFAFVVFLIIIIFFVLIVIIVPKVNKRPYLNSPFTGERDPLGDQIRSERSKPLKNLEGGGEK